MMPNGDPQGGLFNPALTLMIGPYNPLCHKQISRIEIKGMYMYRVKRSTRPALYRPWHPSIPNNYLGYPGELTHVEVK